MYLVDTNVWLERLLDQERAEKVGRFLNLVPTERVFITDFSFHSIGVILSQLNRFDAFLQFVRDVCLNGDVLLIRLEPDDMEALVDAMERFHLDFDDACQYVVAGRYGLTIVSLDGDFDRTDLGRKTPEDLLENKT